MIKKETGQMSFYSHIYDEVIPRDHLLKKLAGLVDFGYVNEVCDGLYCLDNGRPGYNPACLCRWQTGDDVQDNFFGVFI